MATSGKSSKATRGRCIRESMTNSGGSGRSGETHLTHPTDLTPGSSMGPTIVRKIQRADARVIAQLREQGVATVHEAQGRSGLMRPYLRPIYPTAKAAG